MSNQNKIEELSEEIPQGAEVAVISKNEKKARASIAKLNLRKVEGISRVTYVKKGNQIYAIDNPEVYKSVAGTYIVFGEAKLEDLTQRLQQAQAQAGGAAAGDHDHDHDHEHSKDPASITADLQAASLNDKKADEDGDDEEIDETGIEASDIDIVMDQTSVTRRQAVKALKNHNSDIVNAIMELSSS